MNEYFKLEWNNYFELQIKTAFKLLLIDNRDSSQFTAVLTHVVAVTTAQK